MVVPVELEVEVDAQVSNRVGCFDAVFEGTRGVSKPNVGGVGVAGMRVFEENYLCFVWLDGKTCSVEPVPAIQVR